jgi:hypothetical protein
MQKREDLLDYLVCSSDSLMDIDESLDGNILPFSYIDDEIQSWELTDTELSRLFLD